MGQYTTVSEYITIISEHSKLKLSDMYDEINEFH